MPNRYRNLVPALSSEPFIGAALRLLSPRPGLRCGHLRRHLGRRDGRRPGPAHGQVRGGGGTGPASGRALERRPRVHRHRQQVGDRRSGAGILSPDLPSLRAARSVALAETRRVRQPRPGHPGHRRRATDDVDLRTARRRARVRGVHRGAHAFQCTGTSGWIGPRVCARKGRGSFRSPCSAGRRTAAGCSSTPPTKAI